MNLITAFTVPTTTRLRRLHLSTCKLVVFPFILHNIAWMTRFRLPWLTGCGSCERIEEKKWCRGLRRRGSLMLCLAPMSLVTNCATLADGKPVDTFAPDFLIQSPLISGRDNYHGPPVTDEPGREGMQFMCSNESLLASMNERWIITSSSQLIRN